MSGRRSEQKRYISKSICQELKGHDQELKLAWAAGFLDGDGCISAVTQRYRDRKNPSIRIRIAISQNDIRPLNAFREILGERGSINEVSRQVCQNRQPYVLQYDGPNALRVLKKLEPYLVRKKAEAWACQQLDVEGQLSRLPGPKGISEEILERREYWVMRIRRMK